MVHIDLRRKTLVAVGWRWVRDQQFSVATGEKIGKPWRFLIDANSVFRNLQNADGTEDIQQHDSSLPAVESDPGLAVTMLDEFCKARALHWTLEPDRIHSGKYVCMIVGDSIPDDVDIEPCADTIATVCSLAIIAVVAHP